MQTSLLNRLCGLLKRSPAVMLGGVLFIISFYYLFHQSIYLEKILLAAAGALVFASAIYYYVMPALKSTSSLKTLLTAGSEIKMLHDLQTFLQHNPSQKIALLSIDVDNFKIISEQLGESFASHIIMKVAEKIHRLLPKTHRLYYRGSDEFFVLIPKIDSVQEVEQLASKIVNDSKEIIYIENRALKATVSIGISFFNNARAEASYLLTQADTARDLAKELGKSTYQMMKVELSSQNHLNPILDEQLQYVLERNELLLHYQPKIDLRTQQLSGLEGLIRWQRTGQSELIYPDQFIPLAERNGFIFSIGEWVLTTACMQAKDWLNKGLHLPNIAVNVSSRQLLAKNFVSKVEHILRQSDFDPRLLELEITESLLLVNTPSMLRTLASLKSLGLKLSIDDFGTGYSTLTYLSMFPFDKMKIDKYFIQTLTDNKQHAIIIKNIIAIAHLLNMQVVAEGVETREQLDLLKSYNCDEVQGYYYSPAVAQVEIERFLRQQQMQPSTK